MELTHKAVRDTIRKMSKTRDEILENWDYYRGDLARPPYFPYLSKEDDLQYANRIKIVVGYPGAIINRVAAYFRKDPITYSFDVDGDGSSDLAKEAGEVWAAIAEKNNYSKLAFDIARDAGVGGEGYIKPRFVQYEGYTGAEISLGTGTWKGTILLNRIAQAFVYRVPDYYRQSFVEAWARVGSEYKIISDALDPDSTEEYIEVIRPAWYSEIDGTPVDESARVIWKNETDIYRKNILYSKLPFVRFANLVSRPQTEPGIADMTPLKPLANSINHIVSGTTRAIEYHGWPQMVFGNMDPTKIHRATEQSIFLPPQEDSPHPPTVDLLTWDQNIAGSQALHNNLADIMASIAGIPKSLLHELEGAGAVQSGVALRIMYENLNTLCGLKEAGFQAAEENLIKTALEILAYHNGHPGYFDAVNVKVIYNSDRTPRDRSVELEEDTKEKLLLVKNVVDIVLKYGEGVESREGAIKYIEDRIEEDKRIAKMRGVSPPAEEDDDEKAPPFKAKEGDNPEEESA